MALCWYIFKMKQIVISVFNKLKLVSVLLAIHLMIFNYHHLVFFWKDRSDSEAWRVVSSAYRSPICKKTSGASFMNIMNSRRSRMEPCGTPIVTGYTLDSVPLFMINHDLLLKWLLCQINYSEVTSAFGIKWF